MLPPTSDDSNKSVAPVQFIAYKCVANNINCDTCGQLFKQKNHCCTHINSYHSQQLNASQPPLAAASLVREVTAIVKPEHIGVQRLRHDHMLEITAPAADNHAAAQHDLLHYHLQLAATTVVHPSHSSSSATSSAANAPQQSVAAFTWGKLAWTHLIELYSVEHQGFFPPDTQQRSLDHCHHLLKKCIWDTGHTNLDKASDNLRATLRSYGKQPDDLQKRAFTATSSHDQVFNLLCQLFLLHCTCQLRIDVHDLTTDEDVILIVRDLFLQQKRLVNLEDRCFLEHALVRYFVFHVKGRKALDCAPSGSTLVQVLSDTIWLIRFVAIVCLPSVALLDELFDTETVSLSAVSGLLTRSRQLAKDELRSSGSSTIKVLLANDRRSVITPRGQKVQFGFLRDIYKILLSRVEGLLEVLVPNRSKYLPPVTLSSVVPLPSPHASDHGVPFLLNPPGPGTCSLVPHTALMQGRQVAINDSRTYTMWFTLKATSTFSELTSTILHGVDASGSPTIQAVVENCNLWLTQCDELLGVLLTLLHCCSLGPSRATEYLHLRWHTVSASAPATIFVHCIHGLFTKLPNPKTKSSPFCSYPVMTRFYSTAIAEAMMTFACTVRPLQLLLIQLLRTPEARSVDLPNLAASSFFFSSKTLLPWTADRIRDTISTNIFAASKVDLLFNQFRHLHALFQNDIFTALLATDPSLADNNPSLRHAAIAVLRELSWQ